MRPENTAANDAPVEILTPEALARVRSHPRFGEAMREAANGLTRLYEGNRVLNALINDRGRMAMGSWRSICIGRGARPRATAGSPSAG